MRRLLPLLVCLNLAAGAFGQPPNSFGFPDEPLSTTQLKKPKPVVSARTLFIAVDMISVSPADAFDLVRLNSTEMWDKVTGMVKDGTAVSEYLASATTVSDEPVALECAHEFRYPTDFDPPDIPQDFGGLVPPKKKNVHSIITWICPTAYETRNIGMTMEVLPSIREEGIWLELVHARTIFKEFTIFPLGQERSLIGGPQPNFVTSKLQTKVLAQSGKPVFLGAGDKEPGGESRKRVLFFVTATIPSK